jgi:hypothetical protein
MKNTVLFSAFMILAVIMTISCTKTTDDPTPTTPTKVSSIADLNGSWEFVNLKVALTDITTCEQLNMPGVFTYGKPYLMSFDVNSINSTCKLKDKCIDPVGKIYTIKQTYNIPDPANPGTPLFTFGLYDSANNPVQLFMYSSYNAGTETLILSFYILNSAGYLTLRKI